ncbi:MAG: carboxypeptidase-like regulatory domain-containing protein [Tepidisphaeraceae bacterium]
MKASKYALAGALAALMAFAVSSQAEPTATTGTVSGTITTPDGKPAAGVMVRLTKAPAAKPTAADEKGSKKKKAAPTGPQATTDSKGEFKFEAVEAGSYTVNANLKDVGRGKKDVTVTAGQTADASIQLTAPKKKA